MSSKYIKNTSSNRDALFGNAGSSGSKKKAAPRSSPAAASTTRPSSTTTPLSSGTPKKRVAPLKPKPLLSADAIKTKTKEAEEYTTKANNCMKKTLFSSPDPVSASTFFKRAADCYKSLGDSKRERLYRVESAVCNRQCNAWASAAADYTRAAVLAATEEDDPETASKMHVAASGCWRESGDPGKAAGSQTAAAVVLLEAETSSHVSSATLMALEAAVEAHVPDPLNPTAQYRQTGTSLFDGDLKLAQQHRVTAAYAHESIQSIVNTAAERRLLPTALYAAGAVSSILAADGLSTITLARAFWTETVLFLALGDPVAADQAFMNRHLQHDSYLRSRECAAAEDMIRAVNRRDEEALEVARTQEHRAAVGHLPRALQALVMGIRVSGVAKVMKNTDDEKEQPQKPATTEKIADIWNAKTGYEKDGEGGAGENLDAELDALNLGDDDDDDLGILNDDDDNELNELDDDDIDLR